MGRLRVRMSASTIADLETPDRKEFRNGRSRAASMPRSLWCGASPCLLGRNEGVYNERNACRATCDSGGDDIEKSSADYAGRGAA